MKPCKMVIFDLDGTILNTLEDLTNSVNHTLGIFGYPQKNAAEVAESLGSGARKLLERCLPAGCGEETVRQATEEHNRYYAAHCCEKTAPYEGIPAMLAFLRENGIQTAVVSNKPDNAAQSTCQKYFSGLLNDVTGQREDVPRKPAPDAVLRLLQKHRLSPGDAVYVGDTEVDFETAKNAGMICVLVRWGFRDDQTLQKTGNRYFADDPAELSNILNRLCGIFSFKEEQTQL